jgi:hypothetical protein
MEKFLSQTNCLILRADDDYYLTSHQIKANEEVTIIGARLLI